jgi:cyclopropane-fatty-acyl-phospholipid synthase
MNSVIRAVLDRSIKSGNLTITGADGESRTFGDGSGPEIRASFRSRRAEWSIVRDPDIGFGEAIMNGELVVEQGSLYDFLEVILRSVTAASFPMGRLLDWLRFAGRSLAQRNTLRRSRRNVAHHYDLDARLYDLFLDSDRQYSCAYFETPDATLEDAQLAKKRHIAAKLDLRPGQTVLDIGSGWGGLGLYLADVGGADVTGVTLSKEQLAIANARAAESGSAARFLLSDYRSLDRRFDRIVSVGMFEHVGVTHFDEFFAKVRDLLADDGVMVLHSIGRFGPPGATSKWIDKYIFPGGYIPSVSEVMPAIERQGLLVTDMEILRLHYAETLRAWRERFLVRRDEALAVYDERFCRMWEYYLVCSELAFRLQWMMNFQLQITKKQGVLPITRDYIARAEADLRQREAAPAPTPMRLAGE